MTRKKKMTTEQRVDRLDKLMEAMTNRIIGVEDALKNLASAMEKLSGWAAGSDPVGGNRGNSSRSGGDRVLDEFQLMAKKVELPLFNGFDPRGWVTRVETYFEVQGISKANKIKLACLSVDGGTIHWFQTWDFLFSLCAI